VPDLHALVAGFADVAAAYDRGRPEYPPAVIERIVAELGADRSPRAARVLDVGAGTGKLTRPLLAAGLDVVAVEPVERMRSALARAVGPERALDGRAEAIPLGGASVDGAVCAEAFHWFDGERAAAELHRVLRPGGALVVMWLHETGAPTAWEAEVRALLEPLWRAARHPGLVDGHRVDALDRHGGSRRCGASSSPSTTRSTATGCSRGTRRSATWARCPTLSARRYSNGSRRSSTGTA
jgi:SAM-dependent methyltransferase